MPQYEIEQYELHIQTHEVEADNEAEAIAKLFKGKAEPLDDTLEYVEVCEDRGLPADEHPRLVEQVRALDIAVDDVIPNIRNVVRAD
jgi:hypothetical protein